MGRSPVSYWFHNPIGFVSGSLKDASTIKKELHEVMSYVTRLSYILETSSEFSLFKYHLNLFLILIRAGYNLKLARQVENEVHRCELRLYEFNLTSKHVSGYFNICENLLARFTSPSAGYKTPLPALFI